MQIHMGQYSTVSVLKGVWSISLIPCTAMNTTNNLLQTCVTYLMTMVGLIGEQDPFWCDTNEEYMSM